MRTAKTLIGLGGCPGRSRCSLGAHAILLVLSGGSSNANQEDSAFMHLKVPLSK